MSEQANTQPEFVKFNKIPRYFRGITITEKIDGTNSQVYIPEDPAQPVLFGSRNRWITPGKGTDNYDFADWGTRNMDLLREVLGPGRHFGEWWGAGIARKYGLTERRWSLFDVKRWEVCSDGLVRRRVPEGDDPELKRPALPANVSVVPTLYKGVLSETAVADAIELLRKHGSFAVPFMNPEGIVVQHHASGSLFKFTLDGDAKDAPSPEM